MTIKFYSSIHTVVSLCLNSCLSPCLWSPPGRCTPSIRELRVSKGLRLLLPCVQLSPRPCSWEHPPHRHTRQHHSDLEVTVTEESLGKYICTCQVHNQNMSELRRAHRNKSTLFHFCFSYNCKVIINGTYSVSSNHLPFLLYSFFMFVIKRTVVYPAIVSYSTKVVVVRFYLKFHLKDDLCFHFQCAPGGGTRYQRPHPLPQSSLSSDTRRPQCWRNSGDRRKSPRLGHLHPFLLHGFSGKRITPLLFGPSAQHQLPGPPPAR